MGLAVTHETFKKGSTSKTVYMYIQDDSDNDGTGKTGLAYNTGSLVAYYIRPLESAVAISLATQTVTGAWSSGGFVEVDATNMPGWYRLDVPDAVLATGVDRAYIGIKGAADSDPSLCVIELTTYDPFASDLGGGIADSVWDETAASHDTAGSFGETVNDIDNLPTAAAIAAVVLAALVPVSGTMQAGSTSTTAVLSSGASGSDDAYNDKILLIVGGTGAGQARQITDYVGATKTATVSAWGTTPDVTSKYIIVIT